VAILPERRITLGTVGEVHPKVLERMGIKRRDVALWECSLQAMVESLPSARKAEPIRKFPTSTRDMALFVPQGVTVAAIEREARVAASAILLGIEAFDRYEERDMNGELARTSLTFHLIFGADDRTLGAEEVEAETLKVVQALESKLGLELRR